VKELIRYDTDDGDQLLVEVDAIETGVGRVSRPGEIAANAASSLEKALTSVRPAAVAAYKTFSGLTEQPQEVTVAFGIRLTVKAGAVLASSQGDAHFEVTMKWSRA
jgi:Trypsin-co-occurring domain 1